MIAQVENINTEPKPPKPGLKTGAQNGWRYGDGGLLGGRVGSFWNPGGLYGASLLTSNGPIFNLFPEGIYFSGSYQTYRLMRRHPIIALAEAIITGPLDAGAWTYKKRNDDVPDERVAFIESVFDRLRPAVLSEALEALIFGWQAFELAWAPRDGRMVVDRFKPLLQEMTSIVVNKGGELVGLTQGDPEKDLLDFNKSFLFTNNGRTGNYYGVSRLENVRETGWAMWLHAAQQLGRLRKKLSGIIPIIFVPPGGHIDEETGQKINYREQGMIAAQTLHNAAAIVVEHLGLSVNDIVAHPELLKESMTKVDFYDAGNVAQAQGGMIEDLTHAEMLMFAGMLRSSRTGLESQHGSRADSEQHTDTGILDSEKIDREIARQLSAGPVNAVLMLNFGPDAKDSVYIEPAPLVDRQQAVLMSVLEKMFGIPGIGEQLCEILGVNKIIDGAKVPRDKDWKPLLDDEVLRKLQEGGQAAQQQQTQQTPQDQLL